MFDPQEGIMMSVRGSDIFDATDKKVASLSEAREAIQGAVEEMMSTALWYCFIR